jgi:hypothetical protein
MSVTPIEIALRELAVRIALERAELDVRDPVTAAALLSIAVDAFALDTRERLQTLVGDLHDAVSGRPGVPKCGVEG